METNIETEKIINECYDYITATLQKQKKLLPINVLYGDGSRFKNRFDIFLLTYEAIKKVIN